MIRPHRRQSVHFGAASHHLLGDLSGAAVVSLPEATYLFVVVDEQDVFVRLTLSGDDWRDPLYFHIRDFISLPYPEVDENGDLLQEVDLEGVSYDPTTSSLWVTGSFALKRKRVRGASKKQDLKRLETCVEEANRNLLARIPLQGAMPVKEGSASFKMRESGSKLLDMFSHDKVLCLALQAGVVSKENGFDVEGVAVIGDRIFIGLRGPVIDRQAILLEIRYRITKKGNLKACQIGQSQRKFRKHFLPLEGLGIRDLSVTQDGNGLLILAGTSMSQEGSYALYRWDNVLERVEGGLLQGEVETTIVYGEEDGLFKIGRLPSNGDWDKPEGIALLPSGELLVVYDSPHADRLSEGRVHADLFLIQ